MVAAGTALAVAVWLGITWVPNWSESLNDTTERLSWIATLATAVCLLGLWALRTSTRTEPGGHTAEPALAGRALHLIDGELPTVSKVALVALRVKPAIESRSDRDADLPPYVPRAADDRLREATAAGGMVLVHGQAAAGKSRTALHLLRTFHPTMPLVVPKDGKALRELAEGGLIPQPAVVLLDDLERFLGNGGMDLGLLEQLCPRNTDEVGKTVVLATMRDEELSRYDQAAHESGNMIPSTIDQNAVDLLQHLRGDRRIQVDRRLSDDERTGARPLARKDSRIKRALAVPEGFAEYLAAGLAMLDRWSVGDGPEFYLGQALISAAVDCRRAGLHSPVPKQLLVELHRGYLPVGWRDRADLPSAETGLAWASRRILGASSCLLPRADDHYQASDYLVDRVPDGKTPLGDSPVPDFTWQTLVAAATGEESWNVFHAACRWGRWDVAESIGRLIAEDGSALAVFNLGVVLNKQGRADEAEALWTTAAELGDAAAMNNLAAALHRKGRVEEAENWWRAAADLDHPTAMTNLGILLSGQGRTAEALGHYHRAAAAGHGGAMVKLGMWSEEQEDLPQAETWFRAAAEAGDTDGMNELGRMHVDRGELDEAMRWFVNALDAGAEEAATNIAYIFKLRGDTESAEAVCRIAARSERPIPMFNLGTILEERGEHAEAEHWLRKAADLGHTGAMTNLANLLLKTDGDSRESRSLWRKAAKAGNSQAMLNLALDLRRRGKKDEGMRWLRRSAAAGHVEAMTILAAQLRGRDRTDEAEELFRKAADAGHLPAAVQLGELLEERGEFAEAERLWLVGAEADDPRATYCLGVLHDQRADRGAAESWYRKAAELGYAGAMNNLGALLFKKAKHAEAEHWLRRAAESEVPLFQYNLGQFLMNRRKLAEAEEWWRKAAESGDPDAAYNLGVLHSRRGEDAEADQFFHQAARAGNAKAQARLRTGRTHEISSPIDPRYQRVQSSDHIA